MSCSGVDLVLLFHAVALSVALSVFYAFSVWDLFARFLATRLGLYIWRRSRRYRRFCLALNKVQP
jgi:hypothetical protein